MSLSEQSGGSSNPCNIFVKIKGDTGKFMYYDKEDGKNKEYTKLSKGFIVLDERATITGWHDESQSGIVSNEVKNTQTSPLMVRAWKGGVLADGLYGAIKEMVKSEGGKYTKSVYVKPIGENEMVNIHFVGASLSGWIEKKVNPRNSALIINSFEDRKKGSIKYKVPVIDILGALSDDKRKKDYDEALRLDSELQEYFKEYDKRNNKDSLITPDTGISSEEGKTANKVFKETDLGKDSVKPEDLPW